jgi:hypothetical protein
MIVLLVRALACNDQVIDQDCQVISARANSSSAELRKRLPRRVAMDEADRCRTLELEGSPDITWQPDEPGLPAANVLGPGDVAETKGGYVVAIGPGATRRLQPGDVLGTIVTAHATIEYYDTAGRR